MSQDMHEMRAVWIDTHYGARRWKYNYANESLISFFRYTDSLLWGRFESVANLAQGRVVRQVRLADYVYFDDQGIKLTAYPYSLCQFLIRADGVAYLFLTGTDQGCSDPEQ